MQFLGNISAKIDTKSRVFVPAVFRRQLQAIPQNILIMRKDIFQDCLVLYPLEVWEQEVSFLRGKLNRWDREQQHHFRQFVMDAERLEIDANGRILIPKRYLTMLGIESEIQFLGVDNTIEIWAQGKLENSMIPAEEFGEEVQRLMRSTKDE